MAVLALVACHKNSGTPDEEPQDQPSEQRALPDMLSLVPNAGIVKEVISSSARTVVDGVSESDFSVTLTSGQRENIFIVTADLQHEDLSAMVALSPSVHGIPAAAWPRSTLTRMAGSIEAGGKKVIAMINADFWNTSTYIPRGPVHCDGFVYKSDFQPMGKKQGISFVSCTGNGVMNIDYSSAYTEASLDLPEVTGSGIMLTWDGKQLDNSSWPADDRHPRTAIGYTADGFVVFFVVDGRNEGVSDGMTYDDMGSIFEAIGCVRSVNLDGGGSTQLLVRDAAGSLKIANKPADGTERSVVNAWAIVSD